MKLSVLISVFNEEGTVKGLLDHVLAVPIEKEVIVVDDCSTDQTWSVLQSIPDPLVRTFRHEVNQGKGSGIRTALSHATGDLVIIQDADLEYDPNDYPKLLEPIQNGTAQVVYGVRDLSGQKPFTRLGNNFLTFATNLLYNTILSDMETGYKVFRREVLQGIKLRANRFDFEPEFTAKILKRKVNIYEVPISFNPRDYAEGKKIKMKDAFMAIWALFKYRFVD